MVLSIMVKGDTMSRNGLVRLEELREGLADLRESGDDVPCRSRGCPEEGVYFLARVTKTGSFQSGLYCDAHEKRFGDDNLRQLAHEEGGRVVVMMDADGQFDGIAVS